MTAERRSVLAWVALLGPPTLWFAHFGFVYAAASVEIVFLWRAGLPSRLVIAGGTLLALGLVWACWRWLPRVLPEPECDRGLWRTAGGWLALVSAIAILFQAMPALLVP